MKGANEIEIKYLGMIVNWKAWSILIFHEKVQDTVFIEVSGRGRPKIET